jgi:hypothetical protein
VPPPPTTEESATPAPSAATPVTVTIGRVLVEAHHKVAALRAAATAGQMPWIAHTAAGLCSLDVYLKQRWAADARQSGYLLPDDGEGPPGGAAEVVDTGSEVPSESKEGQSGVTTTVAELVTATSEVVCCENGLRYSLRPLFNEHVGLFFDSRLARGLVRSLAKVSAEASLLQSAGWVGDTIACRVIC